MIEIIVNVNGLEREKIQVDPTSIREWIHGLDIHDLQLLAMKTDVTSFQRLQLIGQAQDKAQLTRVCLSALLKRQTVNISDSAVYDKCHNKATLYFFRRLAGIGRLKCLLGFRPDVMGVQASSYVGTVVTVYDDDTVLVRIDGVTTADVTDYVKSMPDALASSLIKYFDIVVDGSVSTKTNLLNYMTSKQRGKLYLKHGRHTYDECMSKGGRYMGRFGSLKGMDLYACLMETDVELWQGTRKQQQQRQNDGDDNDDWDDEEQQQQTTRHLTRLTYEQDEAIRQLDAVLARRRW
jgi:hypothetical protein